jgi:hypothetical protein
MVYNHAMKNIFLFLVFFYFVLMAGCSPNLLYVKKPLDSNPSIAVVYQPDQIATARDSHKPIINQVLEKKQKADLPEEFTRTAVVFADTLKSEYPFDNVQVVNPDSVKDYNYTIYFELDSYYTDDIKNNSTRLKFMATIKMVDNSTGKIVTRTTIASMSETVLGTRETLSDMFALFPPLNALDKLLSDVRKGTSKWVNQIKKSKE